MAEREQFLLSQMVSHKILMTEGVVDAIPKRDGSWFDLYGRVFNPSEFIYSIEIDKNNPGRMPMLEHTRAIAAHYLGLASYPETFYREHKFDNPKPTEGDRFLYCKYIEFWLSITGLLNTQEIQKIRERGWWNDEIASMPPELLFMKEANLPSFEEVVEEISVWKREGWKIALFHGSFDPPTLTHLQNATTAYSYSSVTGVPLKFVIGFDSDILIKRKGKDRPRYPLEERRRQFGRFWMIDETVVLRPKRPVTKEFVQDYRSLGVDYIVMTTNPLDVRTKIGAVLESELEIIPISESPLPSATKIISQARARK